MPESFPFPKKKELDFEKFIDLLRDLEISFEAVKMISSGKNGKKIFIDNFVVKLKNARREGIPAEKLTKYYEQLKDCGIEIED